MTRLEEAIAHADTCGMCRQKIEDIGPLHGPERPPRNVERWSMTKEEWAGMDGPRDPD